MRLSRKVVLTFDARFLGTGSLATALLVADALARGEAFGKVKAIAVGMRTFSAKHDLGRSGNGNVVKKGGAGQVIHVVTAATQMDALTPT